MFYENQEEYAVCLKKYHWPLLFLCSLWSCSSQGDLIWPNISILIFNFMQFILFIQTVKWKNKFSKYFKILKWKCHIGGRFVDFNGTI